MAEIKTSRPFQQRFLDGYDRSQLREEVQKVKPKRFSGMRKKYATWALGASLAFGGLGVPMKMMQGGGGGQQPAGASAAAASPTADANATPNLATDIAPDLKAAQS